MRALSFPYPGAYTYYNSEKIIIDKIAFTDFGYSQTVLNGIILRDQPSIIVKTPNGAVKLSVIRNKGILFKEGGVFK